MRFDGSLNSARIDQIPARVRALEELGFDGAFTFETDREPFSALLLAARASERLELSTGVAYASGREPKALAAVAWDLHVQSGGRFRLGIGPGDPGAAADPGGASPDVGEMGVGGGGKRPDEQMMRLILTLRTLWSGWDEEQSPPLFEQDFYRFTVDGSTARARDPDAPPVLGNPPVLVHATGPRMVEMAARVADGIVLGPFHTVDYLTGTTLPAVERGRNARTGANAAFEVVCNVLVVTGATQADRDSARAIVRRQIAWKAGELARRGVLEAEGWGELQSKIQALVRAGRRDAVVDLVDDEILDRFAVQGTPEEIADRLRDRYEGRASRVAFRAPYPLPAEVAGPILDALRTEWSVEI